MQPTMPVCTVTDAELLARHECRRRWIVRFALVSLLVVFVLAVVFLVITSSSSSSIEEAKELFSQIKSNGAKSEVIKLLGKPLNVENGWSFWYYTRHRLNQTDYYAILYIGIDDTDDLGNCHFLEGSLTGWEAWKFRWFLLTLMLGFKD